MAACTFPASRYIVCLKIFANLRIQKWREQPVHIRQEIGNQVELLHANIIQMLGYFYDETHI
jgi:hypothetical protein